MEINKEKIDNINEEIKKCERSIAEIELGLEKKYKLLDELKNKVKDEDIVKNKLNTIKDIESKYEERLRKLRKRINFYQENDHCPTCEQTINKDKMNALRENYNLVKQTAEKKKASLNKEIEQARSNNEKVMKRDRLQNEFEEVVRLWDGSLPSTILDAENISYQIDELSSKISRIREDIQKISNENMRRERHNTRISIIQEQTQGMENELEEIVAVLGKVEEKATYLELLKKAFSTNGLLAYKIENLVKDLEELTNDYLAELSDGRFSLGFVVTNDKLNVEITDNGNIVDILALSSGELARVNTSTLLAIRKLMSSISSSRINTLFLDEVIAVLDEQGREKLVEILLQENLNTYIVSHGWTHPLLAKIDVIKEDNISRLE